MKKLAHKHSFKTLHPSHVFKMDDDYWRIVNDKLYSTISKGRNALSWNGPNRDEYEDELRLLRPHFNHA